MANQLEKTAAQREERRQPSSDYSSRRATSARAVARVRWFAHKNELKGGKKLHPLGLVPFSTPSFLCATSASA